MNFTQNGIEKCRMMSTIGCIDWGTRWCYLGTESPNTLVIDPRLHPTRSYSGSMRRNQEGQTQRDREIQAQRSNLRYQQQKSIRNENETDVNSKNWLT